MDVTVERVAGIDVAKAEVVVALRVPWTEPGPGSGGAHLFGVHGLASGDG
jgi:hypothetical protein